MTTKRYHESPMLVAVDCVIFGFDGTELKLLLIHRGFAPEKGKWSLMGGFVKPRESLTDAASRVLKQLTGLQGVYMEQLHAYGEPKRDPAARTISVAYYALIDIALYKKQISEDYHPEWFAIHNVPKLIFDHQQMVKDAKERLQYKAALHPVLFELLPDMFTMPQLLNVYQALYEKELDKRNFMRKLVSTGLLVKQKEKEKESSKKGAYYYKLNKKKYAASMSALVSLLPNRELFT
jgi:8-oxo-dGTP diphosphatase